MRLYEFTDPQKYLLPKGNARDLLRPTENVLANDEADDVAHQLRKKPSTKRRSDRL
jgi:hypothetical protein